MKRDDECNVKLVVSRSRILVSDKSLPSQKPSDSRI